MAETDDLDQSVRALKESLKEIWSQFRDPSLTAFERKELRGELREISEELRCCLLMVSERMKLRRPEIETATFQKPEFRILG